MTWSNMTRPIPSRRGVLVLLLLSACGRKKIHTATLPLRPSPARFPAQVPAPGPDSPTGPVVQQGIASWYGQPYHGRRTANGETYDMEAMVAAHRTLPFQTWIRVRNVSNGKTADVRIIDRGPFVGNRIIDLSHAAARQIDLIGPGVAEVELRVISVPVSPGIEAFAVQVGAFRQRANAERNVELMRGTYGFAALVERPGEPAMYRVLAGKEPTAEAAEVLARRIRTQQNAPQAFVVRLDP